MTNEYKNTLLDYLTGNLSEESKSNNNYPVETDTKVVNKSQVGTGTKVLCKDTNGVYNGKYLTYFNNKIYLYDEKNNLLHTYTQYSSGTSFTTIKQLNVDEQGNVYGVEGTYLNNSRFIMMNNLSEKTKKGEYQCILRQSYNIQTSLSTSVTNNSTCYSINKSPQSATYIMTWAGAPTISNYYIFAIQLKINVGIANEWQDFTQVSVPIQDVTWDITTYNYYNDNDVPFINIYYLNYTSNKLVIERIINNNTSLTISQTTNYTDVIGVNSSNGRVNLAVATITPSKFYMIVNEEKYVSPSTNYRIQFLEYNNGGVNSYNNIIGSFNYQNTTIDNRPRFNIDIVNNIPFISYAIHDTNSYLINKVYYGTFPTITDYNYLYEVDDIYAYISFSTTNLYNIYYLTITYRPYNGGDIDFDTYTLETTKIIYNVNNYNGEGYSNKNTLIPKQAILYDENDSLIYARNLYNYKNVENYSYSVLNVPNNLLNDINISNQKLLGDTNYTLVENTENIIKNVYEDLYINFNNQITMSNQNTSNYIDNITGAIRLNQSSGKVLDYDNAKATKIRVTYDDDTSYITSASNNITNNVCTYSIGVHVPNDKNVQSIEIISNDENTTYQTITNLNLENNKYYIITQDVYVV